MHINDFISRFENHPVLFVGTGLSLRYLENSFTWEGLLKKICYEISGREETYLDLKYKYKTELGHDFQKIGADIEDLVDEELSKNRDGHFKDINDRFYSAIDKGVNISRLKIYLSKIFSDLNYKSSKKEELTKFKTVRKNIGSVITTNYDTMIEDIFDFDSLIGNQILLSNPYGSIYKIHGCVSYPEQIIITEDDYVNFQNKYKLIRAQLLSLFIHHPIIFMGYSIQDTNIQDILETIFEYVPPNSELADKIRANFLLIEYEEGSDNEDVTEFDIVLSNRRNIRINKIKTDNFNVIYESLANLRLPVSAMDIRKVQDVVQDLYDGGEIKVRFTEDIDDLRNSDKVLAIGSSNSIKYTYKNSAQIIEMYFKIIDEKNKQLIEIVDEIQIQSQQYFPVYGFSFINSSLSKEDSLKEQQNNRIEFNFDNIKSHVKIDRYSISDILEDDEISETYKTSNIFYNLYRNHIELDDIEDYLRNYGSIKTTEYNKLLCLYDKLKYENK